jgi:hypothetical protein
MKKLGSVIWLLLYIGSAHSQNAFYDALFLKTEYNEPLKGIVLYKDVRQVLMNYFPGKNEDEIDTSLLNLNPFFKGLFLPKGIMFADKTSFMPGALSSVGSLDVTNIADGLAKFLIERVKQELSTSFFENFKKELNNNDQLKIIFPSTFNALNVIDKEIYNYSLYLDLFRESFQKDLAFLLLHVQVLIDDKCMDVVFIKYPEIRTILSNALFIVNEFAEGKVPGEAFHDYVVNKALPDSVGLGKVNQLLLPALETIDLFSQSLRSKKTDQYWVSQDSLQMLFADNQTFQIYFGLIYQLSLLNTIKFSKTITFDNAFKKAGSKIDSLKQIYKPFLIGLIDKGKSTYYYFNAIKKKQKTGQDKPTYQDYYSLFDASINFLDSYEDSFTRSAFY